MSGNTRHAILAVLLAAGMVFMMAGAASAQGIAGSKHDFSTTGGSTVNLGYGSPCLACHVPHPKGATSTYGLLWNRPDHTTTAWQMYDTASLSPLNQGTTAPTGQDLLCLSCHDGTIAMSDSGGATPGVSFISTVTPTNTNITSAALNVSQDLRNDHPVSISYTVTVAAKAAEYNAAPTGVKLFNDGAQDMVRCASCHNPHDGTGGTTGKFLRVPAASLCTACHIK